MCWFFSSILVLTLFTVRSLLKNHPMRVVFCLNISSDEKFVVENNSEWRGGVSSNDFELSLFCVSP